MTDTTLRRPISELIAEVAKIFDEKLDINDGYTKVTQAFLCHPMSHALRDVLVEMKEKTSLSIRKGVDDMLEDPQLVRLDNMLQAEGVAGPEKNAMSNIEGSGGDQAEYIENLKRIRATYNDELRKNEKKRSDITQQVGQILKSQSMVRPIRDEEIERMVAIVKRKINRMQVQLKQSTCENVMTLRSRCLDARRKRRNFSKQSTEVLNAYFYAHLASPYPSEEVKEDLARQCNITVSQVSNWFGNKRIRYKKNIAKANEEKQMFTAKQASHGLEMSNPYGFIPGAPANLLNPYAAMLSGQDLSHMGMPPFDLSTYNPHMMAQYQNSLENLEQKPSL